MADYEVGYAKPPKHTQFKPKQSGNPGGRKKGSRGLKTDLAAELEAKHTIQINKKAVTGSRQKLMLRTLAIRAASGDLKAAQALLPLIVQVLGTEDRNTAREALSAADQALLDQLLAGEAEEHGFSGEMDEPEEDPA